MPEVKSFRPVRFLKRRLQALRQAHHFGQRLRVGGRQVGDMRVGNDHHVPAGVGIAVQNHEVFLAAQQDQGFAVIVCGHRLAENTLIVFLTLAM